jgi:hypothetical protein
MRAATAILVTVVGAECGLERDRLMSNHPHFSLSKRTPLKPDIALSCCQSLTLQNEASGDIARLRGIPELRSLYCQECRTIGSRRVS